MPFRVNSTSVITQPCHEWAFDVAQRSSPSRHGKILFAGVYNCRHISGSGSWSQHAWGNAIDEFAHAADLQAIAENAVLQATKKTFANRGKLVPIHYVIWQDGPRGIWSPDKGWHAYSGYHPPTHVHIDFLPEREGTPPCA
jgi:hypothetical protein